MQEIILRLRYFERRLSALFFLSNPVPFNGYSYQKQKGPGTSDQLLSRLPNKFRNITLLVMYYLTKFDGVIQIGFKLFQNVICKFMQANSWHHKLFHVHLSLYYVVKSGLNNVVL